MNTRRLFVAKLYRPCGQRLFVRDPWRYPARARLDIRIEPDDPRGNCRCGFPGHGGIHVHIRRTNLRRGSGLKRILGLAFLCHLLGSVLTVGSPYIIPAGDSSIASYVLWAAMFLVGSANGLVEIGINPLTTTIYSKEKDPHAERPAAWWPGGLFIGGALAALLINNIMGLPDDGIALVGGDKGAGVVDHDKTLLGWQIKAALVFIPTLIYGGSFSCSRNSP